MKILLLIPIIVAIAQAAAAGIAFCINPKILDSNNELHHDDFSNIGLEPNEKTRT